MGGAKRGCLKALFNRSLCRPKTACQKAPGGRWPSPAKKLAGVASLGLAPPIDAAPAAPPRRNQLRPRTAIPLPAVGQHPVPPWCPTKQHADSALAVVGHSAALPGRWHGRRHLCPGPPIPLPGVALEAPAPPSEAHGNCSLAIVGHTEQIPPLRCGNRKRRTPGRRGLPYERHIDRNRQQHSCQHRLHLALHGHAVFST